jgi:hypothetical protein
VQWTRGSHLAWRPPDGGPVFTSGTPSDVRGIRSALGDLRSAGLELPGDVTTSVPRQRGSKPRARQHPGRAAVLAEARSLAPACPAPAGPDTDLYERLTALRYSLTLLHSFERCPDCPHLGWAHCGHCRRSCGCGMRVLGRVS